MAKRLRSKKAQIDAILEQVDGWDIDTLISTVKDFRRPLLEKEDAKTIDQIYEDEAYEGQR